jgi:uncharacterized protein YbbC (DUF1343 family)
MNQASVDHRFRYACDVLAERFPGQLAAIFSPQHGLWGEQQANMIESPHGRYAPLDVPVYSLYSQSRKPTRGMLDGLECLVIDLQDVGTRVYTFTWTMLECLKACAEADISVVILDRPNPIGGDVVEGPLLHADFQSFVGGASIPLRHGLTLGELAMLLNAEERIGVRLHVVTMDGWRREMLFRDTGLLWVPPSPNMPRIETAQLYPGQVLLEGTNASEGRGTTLPFEVVGAPFIDPDVLAREMADQQHAGLMIRPTRFVPMYDKWQGTSCGGIAIHIVDATKVRSVRFTIELLAAISTLYPTQFAWLSPPYEYEYEKPPIDVLYGSDELRLALQLPAKQTRSYARLASVDEPAWWQRVAEFLLYHAVPSPPCAY